MNRSTIVMQWDREKTVYQYYLCTPPAKTISNDPTVNVMILSQFIPRPDAARILGINISELP